MRLCTLLILLTSILIVTQQTTTAAPPCEIRVVDSENGWPVPLVILKTNHHQTFVTDNGGVIAFDSPELMGTETWFSIEGHGYSVPPDGFGYQGVRLTPEPGKMLTIKVNRELPAKRLGRLTGAGQFAESQKLGREKDWNESGVLGCDSVQIARHNDRLYWAWGDTNLPGYPLGIFDMTSATTGLCPLKNFKPPIRLKFEYFRNSNGKPRGVAPLPGDGPTWLSRYVSLPDETGKHHLVASYIKIEPPLTAYESGLCIWNEKKEEFERKQILWSRENDASQNEREHSGHPIFWTDESGRKWLFFGDPFPNLKMPATFEAYCDPQQWERLKPQQTVPTPEGDRNIEPHRGSVAWNEYRGKWVTIFTQRQGSPSVLGELWYAEAEHPTGPWKNAVKVVTHNNYTFYNPRLHPELTPDDSPILLFEGTYTKQFSGSSEATPRYDYNQILYRLDLDDPGLHIKIGEN